MRIHEDPRPSEPSNEAIALNSFTFEHDGKNLNFRRGGTVLVALLLLGALLMFAAGVCYTLLFFNGVRVVVGLCMRVLFCFPHEFGASCLMNYLTDQSFF